jgi:UrcA family protein
MSANVPRALFIAMSTTFATLAAIAADTQVASEVTVQAERPRTTTVGRDATGAPIVLVEVRHRVSYADLELSIPSNVKVFKTRVRDAARAACADLTRLYPSSSTSDDCARKAEENAAPQVMSAIAAAEARRTAAD